VLRQKAHAAVRKDEVSGAAIRYNQSCSQASASVARPRPTPRRQMASSFASVVSHIPQVYRCTKLSREIKLRRINKYEIRTSKNFLTVVVFSTKN